MTASTRLLILANHQHAALATAIRALLPESLILSADTGLLGRDESARAAAIAALQTSDHVISQDIGGELGPLATATLRAGPVSLHLLPRFRFAGFHPDCITVTLDGGRLAGPTGTMHSRIAAIAYLARLSARDTMGLYNSLVFARLDYFAAFTAQRARLLRDFAAYGYDLAPFFDSWLARGCFMFAATYPRTRVLLDIARLLCGRMGLAPSRQIISEDDLPNPPATFPTHPLFQEIAARIGVSPEGVFRGQAAAGAKPAPMSLEAFVSASFDAFRQMPLSALRAADGVMDAMRALGLREADFGRKAAAARAESASPEEAVFLTWHGRLLGIETATRLVVQTAPWPEDPDSTPAAARIVLPVTESIATTLAGGADIAPGPRVGMVTLAQRGNLLTAPPSRLTPRFAADSAGETECYLAVRRGDLANLRMLAAGMWTTEAGGTPVSGGSVRLLPGFKLAVGRHRIDLASAQLERVTGDGPSLRIAIHGMVPPLTLTLCGVAFDEIALDRQADLAGLPTAASLEQFRLRPGMRLNIQGAPELLHLPLALDRATRAWMHTASREGSVRLGRQEFYATPVRAVDKLILLSRGAEGVAVDEGGIWTRARPDEGASLPPGLRWEDGTLLLERSTAGAAQLVPGPVCLFYGPGLRSWSHWLAGAALALNALAPVLPPGTRLLLPPDLAALSARGGFDHLALLGALGLGGFPTLHATEPLVRAADIIWLDTGTRNAMPAGLLQSLRARAHAMRPPAPPRRGLYVKRRGRRRVANHDEIETLLSARGFETIFPEDLSASEQMDRFGAAAFIVAPHGGALANLVFCQPGTRVLELSPHAEFRPHFWQMSEKLGLYHAVLPCDTTDGTFDGDLLVDADRLRALQRMLRLIAPR